MKATRACRARQAAWMATLALCGSSAPPPPPPPPPPSSSLEGISSRTNLYGPCQLAARGGGTGQRSDAEDRCAAAWAAVRQGGGRQRVLQGATSKSASSNSAIAVLAASSATAAASCSSRLGHGQGEAA